MPLVHNATHPICKRLASYAIEDVDGPLPWNPVSVLFIREVGFDEREVLHLRKDVIETEALVQRTEKI